MLKIYFNNDTENVILASDFNYSAALQITNYSVRSDNINFTIAAESLDELVSFENTPITSIKVTKADDTVITELPFEGNNLYVLSYNTNIYGEDSINSQVNIGRIHIAEESNVGE